MDAKLDTEDAQTLFDLMGSRELAVMHDHLSLWSKNIIELLEKLKQTSPESGGMLAEVYYWRDMDRVLDALNLELKKPFVQKTVKICELGRESIQEIANFQCQFTRVTKGAKEAKWNSKYMQVLQSPVQAIEQAQELKEVQMNIAVLLKSLKHTYMSSNFYKEARIVSFIDRLLACIIIKIKKHCSLGALLQLTLQGGHTDILEKIDLAKSICTKFAENLFVEEIIQKAQQQPSQSDLLQASGHSSDPMN